MVFSCKIAFHAFHAKLQFASIPCIVCEWLRRPVGDDLDNVWGSEECPFDLAPRWLTPPSEVSVNLASARSAASSDKEGPLNLRQMVKLFATNKVAAPSPGCNP